MGFEDQTLTCADCGGEFTFSAGEQEAFARKGFQTPKRCPACRKAKRGRRRADSGPRGRKAGEYRSPAFHDSAPEHQSGFKGRRGQPFNPGGGRQQRGEYRAPAFKGHDQRGQGLYRSPAFRDRQANDEYRAPGFHDQQWNGDDEYRAPGFQDSRGAQAQERPMFLLVCANCGAKQMVPFLPEEEEIALCDECFAASPEGEVDQESSGQD